MGLRAEALATPLRTKIEFSRRDNSGQRAFEPVSIELAQRHHLHAPLAQHYLADAALAQKIGALAHRSETQARDIFDLHLLFARAPSPRLDAKAKRDLEAAALRALDVDYDSFMGQVGAFLEPDARALYASRAAWNQLQTEVVEALQRLAR